MIKEACVGDFRMAVHAIKHGANRLELNADLAQGGITPSVGVIQKTITFAHQYQIPVVVMVRPRGGNFIYSEAEIEIMRIDAQTIAQLGADGIAIGILTSHRQLQTEQLLYVTHDLPLELVFHMAFDEITDQKSALKWLAKHNFQRILTHGGPLNQPLNIKHLQELIAQAPQQIQILPGGGITKSNVSDILRVLAVDQAHGTKII
ncbi:copper homeostasis protein CutC [Bombilactobacillus bombi]|uniref:copper homeostasis protein CutC n=1 Tax=Bombilactobacillus bombi TaxID=1303590 RepID=UPI0015E5A23A|nr:copper homeostasis protein CutC [Bombilactobacillus bombi]MBA1435070.1 copper homeostasis protein CutC [Bombilactobacillus bombi]